MRDVDFFEGQRPLTKVVFVLNKGKRTIACTPWEEWRLIEPCPFTLRCGNTRRETLTQRFGIERSQSASFESTIGSSLGQKGVASLESSLKTTLGEEIKFQVGTEREQTFEFDSPECGYKVVRLYQRVRALHVRYEDTRFWHRDANELTLVHWMKSIYDATHAEQYDPSCNCEGAAADGPRAGIAARIVCGNASKLAVQWEDTRGLEFPDDPVHVPLDPLFSWGRTVDGQFLTDLLPEHLTFLAGINRGESIGAHVWRESVRFATTPGLHGAPEVHIELDEAFEPVERLSGLPLEALAHAEWEMTMGGGHLNAADRSQTRR
jgi:hypothetical protein